MSGAATCWTTFQEGEQRSRGGEDLTAWGGQTQVAFGGLRPGESDGAGLAGLAGLRGL